MAGVIQGVLGTHSICTEPTAVDTTAVLSSTALEGVISAEGQAGRDLLDNQLLELKRLVLGMQLLTEEELDIE